MEYVISRIITRVRIVHGRETVAELQNDFEAFADDFARWIQAQERAN